MGRFQRFPDHLAAFRGDEGRGKGREDMEGEENERRKKGKGRGEEREGNDSTLFGNKSMPMNTVTNKKIERKL